MIQKKKKVSSDIDFCVLPSKENQKEKNIVNILVQILKNLDNSLMHMDIDAPIRISKYKYKSNHRCTCSTRITDFHSFDIFFTIRFGNSTTQHFNMHMVAQKIKVTFQWNVVSLFQRCNCSIFERNEFCPWMPSFCYFFFVCKPNGNNDKNLTEPMTVVSLFFARKFFTVNYYEFDDL